jgi:hypothetical protein
MNERLFVPCTCVSCGRISALAFSVAELKLNLESGTPISLHCGYDDATWTAEAEERTQLQRLLLEHNAATRHRYFSRLPSPLPAQHSPPIKSAICHSLI